MKEGLAEKGLTIEAVIDCRAGRSAQPVHADTYLSSMSEAEWTDLRKIATRTGKTGEPALRCGDCRAAVYARESFKRRRHCYHFSGDHSDCRWSGAVAGNVRAIDAAKFHGQQEGEQHKLLSRLVSEILEYDPATKEAGVSFRRYTKAPDGEYGYPDVYAVQWQGAPAAFEIQLSTTHMPVIARREDFYSRIGVRLMWVIGNHGEDLGRRAFRDIYMRNDGQIFGMDGDVAAEARLCGQPRFRLYRLLPGTASDGFAPQWRNRIVAPHEVNWGAPGDRPRSAQLFYDEYLDAMIARDTELSALREKFYSALEIADGIAAAEAWNATAEHVGGQDWSHVPSPFDAIRALGVLATLRTGKLCVRTRILPGNHRELANSMLLEPPERRCWTHAFELLCQSRHLDDLIASEKVSEKCARNRAGQEGHRPLDVALGPVFNVFFPEGAFYRLMLEE